MLAVLVVSYNKGDKLASNPQHINFQLIRSDRYPSISLRYLRSYLRRNWPEALIAGSLLIGLIAIWCSLPDPLGLRAETISKSGRPLEGLHAVRTLLLKTMPWWKYIVAIGCSGLSLGLMIAGLVAHRRKKAGALLARSSLLIAACGLAYLGQLQLLGYFNGDGLWLYISALALFMIWVALTYPDSQALFKAGNWSPLKEAAFLLGASLLTIFARFYAIGALPYGIEGDESKWSVEVISAMRYGEYPHSADYHLGAVPLSFWMQAPFLIALGPTVFAGRVAVASYSLLDSLCCYWLVRQILGQRLALLSMLLLAVSLLDTSASRLANVESHVKLWPPLALALLARAIQNKSLFSYLLAGVATGLGFLTYETVTPLGGVMVVIMAIEWWRERASLESVVRRSIAFFIPLCFVLPVTLTYLYSRLDYYEFGAKAARIGLWEGIVDQIIELGSAIFVQVKRDFLYNRAGPLLQGLLLPWLAFGIALSVLTWRQSRLYWILIWALFFFIPAPALAHMPAGRVFYPGLPALYILSASALLAAYSSLRSLRPSYLASIVKAFSSVALGLFIVQSLYISFNEITDYPDRINRRELYDLARTHAADDHMLLFPYLIAANDPIQQEGEQLIRLGMRRPDGSSYPFSLVEMNELLARIANTDPNYRISVIWDSVSSTKRAELDQVLAALLDCYPETQVHPGRSFHTYSLSREAIAHARCTSGTITLKTKESPNERAYRLAWSIEAPQSVAELHLRCDAIYPETIAIPAERLKGTGWRRETAFALDFEDDGFLEDLKTDEPAVLRLSGLPHKPHYIWVRSYRRQHDGFPGQLALNGQILAFSHDDVPLNTWHWERVGPFMVDNGSPLLSVMRPYSKQSANFRGLFIDTLILTTSPEFDPTKHALWKESFQHTIQLAAGQTSGSLPLDLSHDHYRCTLSAPPDSTLVNATGQGPLQSQPLVLYLNKLNP